MRSNPATASPLVKYVALYSAYVLGMHAIPGPWRNWKDGNGAVDTWTATHVAWGAIGQRMGLSPTQVLYLSTVNEILEAGVRHFRPDLLWGTPESPANVILDLVATWAGWELANVVDGQDRIASR